MPETAAAIRSASQWQEAYRAGNTAVRAFHRGDFADWRGPFGDRDRQGARLAAGALQEWGDFLRGFGAGAELLEPLRQPGATVVVTGQQAGAGGGPLYTLWKALAARAWAAEVSATTGKPCVPVFWVASDDHDLAEIEKVHWLGTDGEPREFSLAPDAAGNARPVFDVSIDEARVQAFLAAFEESTSLTDFRGSVLALLRESFGPGATFESHFLHLVRAWLMPLGIVPIVPRLRFVRQAAAPIIAREIAEGDQWQDDFRRTAEAMEALGMKPPLVRTGTEANFFVEVDGVRAKVLREAAGFVALRPGTRTELARWSTAELTALLEAEPGRFSPNALLRPLVQDVALPTVAYIAGPTELVYHGQLGPLYSFFGVTRPAVIPRPNVVLLEAKALRAAEKLGLERSDLCGSSAEALEKKLTDRTAAAPLARESEAHLAEIAAALRRLDDLVKAETRDTALLRSLEKLQGSLETGTEKFRERLTAFLATQDAQAAAARARLMAQLFPGGEPQERRLTPLSPLMLNHGPEVLPLIADSIDYRAGGVQAVELAALHPRVE